MYPVEKRNIFQNSSLKKVIFVKKVLLGTLNCYMQRNLIKKE